MMQKDLRKRFGEQARDLREKLGLTQQDVANQMGIRQTDLSAFENHGEKIGSIERLNALFECLGHELGIQEKKTSLNCA